MKTKYIKTPTKEIWEAAQAYLFSLGFVWRARNKAELNKNGWDCYQEVSCICIESNGELMYASEQFCKDDGNKKVALEEVVFKSVPDIKIGEYIVEFKGDGIMVGCQLVTKDTVIEIYARLMEGEK